MSDSADCAVMVYLHCCVTRCPSARVELGMHKLPLELIFLRLRVAFLPSPTSHHRLCVQAEPLEQFFADSTVTNGSAQRKLGDDVLKYGLCVKTFIISKISVPFFFFTPEIFVLCVACEGLKYSFQMAVD